MTPQEAIKKMNILNTKLGVVLKDMPDFAKTVIEALEKQIPKKPIWLTETYEHHDWLKDDDGNIDEWASSVGFHNGPMCARCYTSFCILCCSDYEEKINEPCDNSHWACPTCEKETSKGNKRCLECGQALDWGD